MTDGYAFPDSEPCENCGRSISSTTLESVGCPFCSSPLVSDDD